jgi:hypothetical protein
MGRIERGEEKKGWMGIMGYMGGEGRIEKGRKKKGLPL